MTTKFNYRAPVLRAELLSLLADHGPDARVLAGGTDLLGDLRNGFAQPSLVVNLKNVEGYSNISWSRDDGLVIRAAVTINDVLQDAKVRDAYPLLVACAQDLASHQIRNRATVIGNVVNASPCADMAPALLCLQASAVLSSQAGERMVPFSEFFTGVKRTVMRADEILEEIIVPAETAGARGCYHKLKRIKGHDLGIVGVAAMNKEGTLRLGISSCAPTPLLVEGLTARDPVDAVVAAVHEAISPISDVRCSREYREHMVAVFVRRALQEVA
ncbi:MAG TPA: FAD binding domain-containing protein [Dermatophilaceae bacterium]